MPPASSASPIEVPISTNSSPPKRATVSAVRTTRRQPARDFLQKFIARAMAQGIVDELEAVEIADQQRKRAPVTVGMRDGLLQAVVQQDAIRQAGQRIVGGQMPQLLIRGFQPARAGRDHLLEAQHLVFDQPSFSHLRQSAVAHCSTSIGSAGLRNTSSLSE